MIAPNPWTLRFAISLLPMFAAVAFAEDKPAGGASSERPKIVAPVGHRQPTAADVAKAEPPTLDPTQEKSQRELDKKLQICRGC